VTVVRTLGRLTFLVPLLHLGLLAPFMTPYTSLVVDSAQTISWTDSCRVRQQFANGTQVNLAGQECVLAVHGALPNDVEGFGTNARFPAGLLGIALGQWGELLVLVGSGSVRNVSYSGYAAIVFVSIPPVIGNTGMPLIYTRSGPSNKLGRIGSPRGIAVDKQGYMFYADTSSITIGRIGLLSGAACLQNADADKSVCGPGTSISWANQTCVPCAPAASRDYYGFTSYCVGDDGYMYHTAPSAIAASAGPASAVGGIVGGVLVLLLAVAAAASSAGAHSRPRCS
jgi:hypothetical protein